MNTLIDVREAQQMWEYKLKNAGHEGINLNTGKPRSLGVILGSILHTSAKKAVTSEGRVRLDMSKSGVAY